MDVHFFEGDGVVAVVVDVVPRLPDLLKFFRLHHLHLCKRELEEFAEVNFGFAIKKPVL